MKKVLGIFILLVAVCVLTTLLKPQFLDSYNIQNVLRRTSLYAIIGIGVSFVIITGGIDLSIGSLAGLCATLTPMLLVEQGWPVPVALAAVLAVAAAAGVIHGLFITKLKLQPFIVTLCGLLIYRGAARWVAEDKAKGFGGDFQQLREWALGTFGSVPVPFFQWITAGNWSRFAWDYTAQDYKFDAQGNAIPLDFFQWVDIPIPVYVMALMAILAGLLLNFSVWGRYLLALGGNEQAARYSGIKTDRLVILAYVICATLAGVVGVLSALDDGSVQPSGHANFWELYAIAAAVLGGCSLRGGEGSILGVVIGAAIMRVLYNSINLVGIPSELEFAVIGQVILIGVIVDELVKRAAARRTRAAP